MKTDQMKILTVGGSPHERGRSIGESLRENIHTVLALHAQALDRRPGYSATEYFAAFDRFHAHLGAVEKWAPDLLEEVWGLAEGANISRETAFRLQLGDEDWFFDAYHYRPRANVKSKCTAFGLVGDEGSPSYAGQNMDVMSYVEGHQVLLRVQHADSELETLVFTYAGVIALCGMNNAPLGVNCNTLMQLGYRPDGLPVAFVARRLTQMRSFDDAVTFLSTITHAAGQNYTVSTQDRVGSFECSPNKVVEYRPRADGRRVCHTNHPLANDDTASFKALTELDSKNKWVLGHSSSCSRLASIAARTVYRDGAINLDDLKAALRAKDDPNNPVCRDLTTDLNENVIAYTAGSLIYECGDTPRLHLASGPPSESEFLTFKFSR
jgi:predicted choloylglycine hydrolase